MGKTKRAIESLYLDPDRLDLLKKVAAETRIARAALLREAVDDLLIKYKALKPAKYRP
jgi:Ribbon-helix-helix domain